MSRKEEALWLLESLVPGTGVNNLSVTFEVDGRLDRAAVRDTMTVLTRRHPILRTTFTATGDGLSRTVLPAGPVVRDVDDLTEFIAEPFRFDGGPLLRAGLFDAGDRDVCCLAVHHLIFDTQSSKTLLREFAEVYDQILAGQTPDVQERQGFAEPEPKQDSLDYWRDRLSGARAPELRCGTTDVADPTLRGDRVLRTLSPEAAAAVRVMRKELRAPEAVVLLAAYVALLAAHGAGEDVVVGSPVDIRPPAARDAIGYHVNVVPLRVAAEPGSTFRQLVLATREVFFESLVHLDVPVDDLAADVGPGRNVLFRHLFNYITGDGLAEFTIGGLTARPLMTENGFSKFDLELFVISTAGEIGLRAVYGTEFLDRETVEAMLARYEALLLTCAADPDRPTGELRVWSDQDHAVIEAANRTATPLATDSVLAAIPVTDEPAVVDGDRTATYRQLWELAEATRRLLVAAGVTRGDVVAVAAPRGVGLAAAVLGTWLAGAAYLPIDPEHPEGRIAFQLEDSGARVVLADTPDRVAAGEVLVVPEHGVPGAIEYGEYRVAGDSPAYLIYTSGSTGTPKGTLVSHRSLANLVADFAARLDARPGDGALWLTTFAFDISGLELFVPLTTGGRVVVAPDQARMDGRVLRELITGHDVRVVQATPTTWRVVLDAVADSLRGRKVLCGGESAPVQLAEDLLATGCEAHHVYGPTETTIWSTTGPFTPVPGQRLDVGKPIANTQVMVMDPAGRELPPGVRGELCIAGAGVAIGYHDRPDLTAQRFGEHTEHGRYYRTGDEARWRPDGTLELLGRADRQVKVRGNRIELGEIEAALSRHPRVKATAVVLAGDASADASIVAFVVTAESGLDEELRQHALRELPKAMRPQEFTFVDTLPTNANEKIDYPALTRRAAADRAGRPVAEAAGHDDELVATLIGLWRDVLESAADADTHFFENGGHSLKGALLVQRIEERTGIEVRLADLFAEPTPLLLARKIRG
jgi:amino acid adenylation domain-containing protein